jgi:D-3-phosphoglycerate dehydrogenase
MRANLIIDFDSTFITLESLDELAKIALSEHKNATATLRDLERLTDQGMTGEIGFGESLRRRVAMFKANRRQITQLIKLMQANVTPSIVRNRDFFRDHAAQIYIISGGFGDYIWPVVKDFGLSRDHVLANRFEYNAEGEVTGCDQACLLAHDDGKPKQVEAMQLGRPVYVIGDGYTDYQIRSAGQADKFFAFTENVSRPMVTKHADVVLADFDEFMALDLLNDGQL